MSRFDSDAAQELFERELEAVTTIVVSTHLRPDGDAIGSETGLVHYLLDLGKRVRVINNDPTGETLRFLEPEGVEVEVYEPERHDGVFEATDLVLLVDNSAPDRLGRLEEIIRRMAPKVLCIDHHPAREAPWEQKILDVDACATAVIIYRLVRRAGWTPDMHAARAMFAGMATDTGFFRFSSTNVEAHRVAGELLGMGVDPAEIYREVHERNSVAFTLLLGHALAGLEMSAEGAVASVRIPLELIVRLSAADEDTSEITTAMLAIDGVEVVALFRELPDLRVKVSLRSKCGLDVHLLAAEYGGGGHRNASGIVMPGALDEVARQILDRVRVGVVEGR